jgi:cold shock CspA family protein
MPGQGILETVVFEAVYEDGQRVQFEISRYVRKGDVDAAAKILAVERQREGKLPEGRIVSVERFTS